MEVVICAGDDGVRVVDPSTQMLLWSQNFPSGLSRCSVAADQSCFALTCTDKHVYIVDSTFSTTHKIECEARPFAVCFLPHVQHIAYATQDGSTFLYDYASRSNIAMAKLHSTLILDLKSSVSGRFICSASDDKTVAVLHSNDLTMARVFEGHTQAVRAVAMLPDDDTVLSGGLDYAIRVWSISANRCEHVLQQHSQYVEALAIHPSGAMFASGSHDRSAIVWDTATFTPTRTFRLDNRIGCILFSPVDNMLLVGVSGVGIVQADIEQGIVLGTFAAMNKWAYGLARSRGEFHVCRLALFVSVIFFPIFVSFRKYYIMKDHILSLSSCRRLRLQRLC
jgi:WD40 repeat protein